MDNADRAQALIEAELDACVSAARGISARWRTHCQECGESLEVHRQPYGRCVECQLDVERWERLRGGVGQ